ncbi:MAG: peroxidase [Nitrospinota bacterium]
MSYIKTIEPKDAYGTLKEIYERLQEGYGRVPNLIRVQSLRPDLLEAVVLFFERLMLEAHTLSRTTKELLAAYVSKINACAY